MTVVHHRSATGPADTALLVRRFLADYRRNPVNLLVVVLVPVVFVVVAAGPMADAAKLLGGMGVAVQTATALLALAARSGIGEPGRAIAGTLMFAVIYLAIGAVVGVLVRNPVNGTVLILFIWIMDVFFGPGLGSPDRAATRWLPTHFVTLWMVDLPSRHGGRLGDLGWALVWTVGALAIAAVVLTATTRVARRAPRRTRAWIWWDQFTLACGWGCGTSAGTRCCGCC